MNTYTSKRGQKSRRAKWKDRRERAYYAENAHKWERSIALMTPARAANASRGLTPRTGALLVEWAELHDAPAALLEELREQEKLRTFAMRYANLRVTAPRLAPGTSDYV